MEITDYISGFERHYYPMWVPKFYQRARKRFSSWISVRPYNKSAKTQQKIQNKTLFDYIQEYPPIILPKAPYLKRFRSLPVYSFDDFALNHISKYEWDLMQLLPEFTGYFNHIFEINDLSFFDDLQEELEAQNVHFKDIFLYDIIGISLFQRFLGIESYAELERLSYFLGQHPLKGIVHDPLFFPTAKDLSYILHKIPVDEIYRYFFQLVKEMIDLRIIIPRILVWDGQFMRSNCNNNFKDDEHKKLKQYNDPDAGYHRHNGQQKGVGYEVSNLYCYCGSWDRSFPVYFEIFPGNKSENPMFRQTLNHFLKSPIGKGWQFIILDSGAYSEKNIQFCLNRGIYPLVRAKKNIKSKPTKELRDGYWFRTDFIPVGWTEKDIVDIYKIRPVIEAGQAANNFFYNSQRMNTRGIENAVRSRGLNYIFDLLRAITAVKLNRIDLINKLNSFSTNREFMSEIGWMKAAKQANFDIFHYPALSPFQKKFWDKRRAKSKRNGKNH